MQRTKLNLGGFHSASISKLATVAVLMAGCLPARSMAQQAAQKTFSSAREASDALASAAETNDDKALFAILGPDGKRIVYSGDTIEDSKDLANFVQMYQKMHRLVKEPDGMTTLYVGPENWPMPIPIANKGNSWYFDTAAGRREILYRRIGRNEISTIHVCQELVTAEKEYYSAHNNEYAQKIFSDQGQQNGLYWNAANGERQSPIGPLVANAVAQGYPAPTGNGAPRVPYRGYYYLILTRQGASASGGVENYIDKGKMTQGFAFVAYPAEYRASGVMTFIVGTDGVVYRKDLGRNTSVLAKAMKEFNPDPTWKKDEDQQEESAAGQ